MTKIELVDVARSLWLTCMLFIDKSARASDFKEQVTQLCNEIFADGAKGVKQGDLELPAPLEIGVGGKDQGLLNDAAIACRSFFQSPKTVGFVDFDIHVLFALTLSPKTLASGAKQAALIRSIGIDSPDAEPQTSRATFEGIVCKCDSRDSKPNTRLEYSALQSTAGAVQVRHYFRRIKSVMEHHLEILKRDDVERDDAERFTKSFTGQRFTRLLVPALQSLIRQPGGQKRDLNGEPKTSDRQLDVVLSEPCSHARPVEELAEEAKEAFRLVKRLGTIGISCPMDLFATERHHFTAPDWHSLKEILNTPSEVTDHS